MIDVDARLEALAELRVAILTGQLADRVLEENWIGPSMFVDGARGEAWERVRAAVVDGVRSRQDPDRDTLIGWIRSVVNDADIARTAGDDALFRPGNTIRGEAPTVENDSAWARWRTWCDGESPVEAHERARAVARRERAWLDSAERVIDAAAAELGVVLRPAELAALAQAYAEDKSPKDHRRWFVRVGHPTLPSLLRFTYGAARALVLATEAQAVGLDHYGEGGR